MDIGIFIGFIPFLVSLLILVSCIIFLATKTVKKDNSSEGNQQMDKIAIKATTKILLISFLSVCIIYVCITNAMRFSIINNNTPPFFEDTESTEKEDDQPPTENPTHAHVYEEYQTVAPTKEEKGYTIFKCRYCDDSYKDNFVMYSGSVGLAYEMNDDPLACTIIGIGTCTDTEIYIPQFIDEYKVTAIGSNAFAENTEITKIVLPDEGITEIGSRAFYKCTALTEINIPESVITIGTQIFHGANNLTTVYYDSLYSPSKDTGFLNQRSIEKVLFGGTTVPAYICYQCPNLKEIEFTDNVTTINEYAFFGCNGLTDITMPASITTVQRFAFNCAGLTSVTVSSGALYSTYHKNSSTEYVYFWNHFNSSQLTTVTIAPGVTTIPAGAFRFCSLQHLILSEGVTTIEESAFWECKSLGKLTVPSTLETISGDAIKHSNGFQIINITDMASWCAIEYTGQYPFASVYDVPPLAPGGTLMLNDEPITDFVVPETVTLIKSYTFLNCGSLTSIVIPGSVAAVSDHAFQNCENLVSVHFQDGISRIADSTFNNCEKLESITLTNSVSYFGTGFSSCPSLSEIYFYGTPDEFHQICIYSGTNITVYYYKEDGWVIEENFF